MLVGHLWWLYRVDFVEEFVAVRTGSAVVAWRAAIAALEAGRLPCSGGEAQVLRIAASIAAGVGVDLSQALTGLDDANLGLVARAVGHAGGRRTASASIGQVWS
ncbi:MAG: hypothetical protein ACRDTT_04715 [Pseudonocardiaceae bacterium]